MMSDSQSPQSRWESTSERSTPFMLRLLLRCALLLGRSGLRPIVYLTVAYFFLTSRQGRRTSRQYLRRALGRAATWLDVWRHFLAFATCSTDRFFLLSNRDRGLNIDIHRSPEALAATSQGTGCLLVMAHFGSFEVVRVRSRERNMPISILLDRDIGKMLTQVLETLNPDLAAHVIDASRRGPELVLKLKEELEQQRMIGLMADRTRAGDRSIRVEFLGGQAAFPLGPWMLAGALGVPVIIGFGLYLGGNRYEAHLELFAERIDLPRANREAALCGYAQQYARRLEHYVRRAPYNWFNFYDFWQ